MIRIFICISLLWVTSVYSAQITKSLNVETTLNSGDFFAYNITGIKFDPDFLMVQYDDDINTFQTITTTLHVETNIPSADTSIEHVLSLTENSMTCTDEQEQLINTALTTDLVNLHVGEAQTEFTSDEAIQLEFNGPDTDLYRTSTQLFTFSFEELPADAFMCRGEVAVIVEFNL